MLGFFYMIPTNSFIFISFIDICDYSQKHICRQANTTELNIILKMTKTSLKSINFIHSRNTTPKTIT